MLKRKWTVLVSATVLAVVLAVGATYSWFTAQASASVGGSADGNGIDGGLVAGHVDVKMQIRSYSTYTDATGTHVLDGETGAPVTGDSTSYSRPLIIYPGDLVDYNGNPVKDAISHIEYTLTNTSGTDIIARTNHAGVTKDAGKNLMNNANDGTKGGSLGSVLLMSYLLRNFYGDAYAATEAVPDNWFYLGSSPTNTSGTKNFMYVNKEALDNNDFIPYFIPQLDKLGNSTIRTALAGTKTSSGKILSADTPYDPSVFYYQFAADRNPARIGVTSSGKVVSDNANVKWAIGKDNNGNASEYIYFYMPKDASVTVTFDIKVPDDTNPNMNVQLYDNRFQYAVYLLNLKAACGTADVEKDADGNPLFEAYGVQAIKAAVDDFFGPNARASIETALPIK